MSLSQTSDEYLGNPRQPIAIAVDRENTLPFKETPTMPQTQIDTTKSPEGTPAKVLKMRPGNKRPPKWVLKDGKEDLLCDESSLQNTFGTADEDLMWKLLEQATTTVPNTPHEDLRQCNPVLAAIHGIGPRDTLEGMLAVQMVAAHDLAMEFLRRAALKEQPDLGVDLNLNRATKLQRTFIAQMEALNRHRGKGEQKMNVEHVHVHDGAQAIVGPVSHQKSEGDSEEDHGKYNRQNPGASQGLVEEWESAG